MIEITTKNSCCGCGACVQRCPEKCINMKEDEQGFLYPQVDNDLCIGCGLCEKVCPIINKRTSSPMPDKVVAFKHNDAEVRKKSSSGGFFTALAETIISQNGVVFGARFDDSWNVIHDYAETKEELSAFRGSKYVQSQIKDSFKQAELFLKEGRTVLFTGTPCQVSALHLYLCKDYENLYTMDFVCHGVPSPGVFRWYLQEELNNIDLRGDKNTVLHPDIHSIPEGDIVVPLGIEVKDIRFRDKRAGWKKYSFALDIAESAADGEKIQFTLSKDVTQHTYLRGFVRDLYLRPSCFSCPAKSLSSHSDFTVSDFWGQEYSFPDFDNDTGVSAIITNSSKAESLLQIISNGKQAIMDFGEYYRYNPAIANSVSIKRSNIKFWKYYGMFDFETMVTKALHVSLYDRVISKINQIKNK